METQHYKLETGSWSDIANWVVSSITIRLTIGRGRKRREAIRVSAAYNWIRGLRNILVRDSGLKYLTRVYRHSFGRK